MSLRLSKITFLVREYDEAIAWFTSVLGFTLVEDSRVSDSKRWVEVAPAPDGPVLLLARAATATQVEAIGRQGGGRVTFFLDTDNFARDHAAFVARGVQFVEEPRQESYGTVAVFLDLYGNKWDLVERRPGGGGHS